MAAAAASIVRPRVAFTSTAVTRPARRSVRVQAASLALPDNISKVMPKGDLVLARVADAEEKTSGGILLPGSAQSRPTSGDVVALGDGQVGTKQHPFTLKGGETVLYSKFGLGCTELEVQGQTHILIREDDIIGVMPRSNATAADIPDLKPLGDRVLVRVQESADVTMGGVILPDSAKERPLSGTVVRCGPGKVGEDGQRKAPKVKEGDRVIYFKYAGDSMETPSGEKFNVLHQSDILAKLRSSAPVAGSGSAADHHHEGAGGERALHPAALTSLYLMYMAACLVERTWRFGLPLVLAFVEGGFQAIAILGFVAPLACALAGPAMGRLLDSIYRPLGLGVMLVLQDLAILLSAVALVAARVGAPGSGSAPLVGCPLFGLLLVLTMLEKLTSISSELAIERDWVTQLAGKTNVVALARSNAYLRRTDLLTELVGALVFGAIYSWGGLPASMAFTAVLAALAIPLQLFFIARIADLAPSAMLHGRHEPGAPATVRSWRSFLENARLKKLHAAEAEARRQPLAVRIRQQLAHSMDSWRSYFAQPILPSSLTFVLLFFNVVLSPGGLITAFLTLWGFNGNAMAIFRGGCATCGFLGTLIGKHLIQSLGLLRAGAAALAIQACLLAGATALYAGFLSGPPALGPGGGVGLLAGGAAGGAWPMVGGVALPVVVFAALVVMSRIGVWSYDMVNSQLFQQTVAPREMASASSAEMALCSFCELLMLGMAAASADPAAFPLLVYASFGAVLVANALFRTWAARAQPSVDLAIASVDVA